MLYCSHKLSTQLYGQVQTLWLHTSVFATIIGLGLATFLYSYNAEKLYQIWHQISAKFKLKVGIIVASLALLFVVIQLIVNGAFYSDYTLWPVLFIYILTFSIGLVLDALAIIFNRLGVLIAASIGFAVCYSIAHWGFVNEYWGSSTLIYIITITAAIKCICIVLALRKIRNSKCAESVDLSKVIKHWIHIGVYDIFQMVFRFLDKFILSFVITKSLLAIYTNATYEIPVFSIVFVSIQNAGIQLFHQKRDEEQILDIIKKTSFLLGVFCISAFVFFLFNGESFMRIVFSEKYIIGLPLFYIACFKILVYMFNVVGYHQYKEQGQLLVKHTYIDFLFTTILGIPAYMIWGLYGLTVVMVLGSFLFVGLNIYAIKKATTMNVAAFLPIKEWIGLLLFFVLLNFVLNGFSEVFIDNAILSFLTKLIINAIIALILLFRFKKQFNL